MSALSAGWLAQPREGRARALGACLAALGGHLALVWGTLGIEPPVAPPVAITEIELAPPPPPPPAPPPVESAPVSSPAAAIPAARRVRAAKPAASAPPPAAAPPVMTAPESAPSAAEPVRFASGPSGAAFGFGSVAGAGRAGAQGGAGQPVQATGEGGRASPSLSRTPRLDESEPCRGFFPASARIDRGEVSLRVAIGSDGRVGRAELLSETPSRQGFGAAARACLLSKRFLPALDRAGREVAVVTPIAVRFSR